MCHLRSADLQPQGLIKLQVWKRLCIRTREVRPLIMTRFRRRLCDNHCIATLICTDAGLTPWTMEQGSRENAVFQFTQQGAYRIMGTQSSLELPVLRLWDARDPQHLGWDKPLNNHYFAPDYHDSYQAQFAHFQSVIRQDVAPVVSVPDAANTLSATLAIAQSSQSGQRVTLQRF